MPQVCRVPVHVGRLAYSWHAQREASLDRHGRIDLPTYFDAANAELIEAEAELAESGEVRVVKQVWRQPLDGARDLVLVIARKGKVITVWVNRKGDTHRTLQRDRYVGG